MVVVSAQVHAQATVRVVVTPLAVEVASTMLARALTKTNHLTRTNSMLISYRTSPRL